MAVKTDVGYCKVCQNLTEFEVCPVCNDKLEKNGKTYSCSGRHCFDISKEAVNEIARLMNGGEGKNMVLPHEIVRLRYEDIIR